MDKIKIHAPATVANLSCGFDVLGLCLDQPYDEIEIQKTHQPITKYNLETYNFSFFKLERTIRIPKKIVITEDARKLLLFSL